MTKKYADVFYSTIFLKQPCIDALRQRESFLNASIDRCTEPAAPSRCPLPPPCLISRKTLVQFYVFIVAIWCLVFYVLAAVGYLVIAVVVSGM